MSIERKCENCIYGKLNDYDTCWWCKYNAKIKSKERENPKYENHFIPKEELVRQDERKLIMDDDKQLYIIDHFGLKNQQRKLSEEVFELQEAIFEDDRKHLDYRNHVLEELADVLNVLQQIQKYYKFTDDEVKKVIDSKIGRTLDRIDAGYYFQEL